METQPQVLSERWQLLDRIGEGAMGEVWRGVHTVLGHEVAIKLMKGDRATDASLVARFRREARIAAQIRHRNLVRVEDFGTSAEGRPFLVMELLRGQTLSAALHANPRPGAAMTLSIAQQIASACDIAHRAGIVHRDLKPDNCFLANDEDGRLNVKVLDFGVAKVTDDAFRTSSGAVTAANALVGTPVYMSPEQVRGEAEIDGRSDLWSLGVITYEMLTGMLPFPAANLSQLVFAILGGPIAPPSSLDASYGPSLDAWVARALHRERASRFGSGSEMVHALAAALGLHAAPSVHPPAMDSAHAAAPLAATAFVPSVPGAYAAAHAPTAMLDTGGGADGFAPTAAISIDGIAAASYALPRPAIAPTAQHPMALSLPPTQALPSAPALAAPFATQPYPPPPPNAVFAHAPIAATQTSRTRGVGVMLLVAGLLLGMGLTAVLLMPRHHHSHASATAPPTAMDFAARPAVTPVVIAPPVLPAPTNADVAPIAPPPAPAHPSGTHPNATRPRAHTASVPAESGQRYDPDRP